MGNTTEKVSEPPLSSKQSIIPTQDLRLSSHWIVSSEGNDSIGSQTTSSTSHTEVSYRCSKMNDDSDVVCVSMHGLGKDKRFGMNLILPAEKFNLIKRRSLNCRPNVSGGLQSSRSLGSISVWTHEVIDSGTISFIEFVNVNTKTIKHLQ